MHHRSFSISISIFSFSFSLRSLSTIDISLMRICIIHSHSNLDYNLTSLAFFHLSTSVYLSSCPCVRYNLKIKEIHTLSSRKNLDLSALDILEKKITQTILPVRSRLIGRLGKKNVPENVPDACVGAGAVTGMKVEGSEDIRGGRAEVDGERACHVMSCEASSGGERMNAKNA